MKTPDEIKKGLGCCTSDQTDSCDFCPYQGNGCNEIENLKDALAYINQLEADLARVTAERDAAKEDLRIAAINGMNLCEVCKYAGRACEQRRHVIGVCWEWRGVDKEEITCEDEFFWDMLPEEVEEA